MNISKKEYAQLADRYSVPSKLYITLPKAFVIGGLICCTGQFFNDLYIMIGNDADTASAYTSITLVLISALLTGFGQYERIALSLKHIRHSASVIPQRDSRETLIFPGLPHHNHRILKGFIYAQY